MDKLSEYIPFIIVIGVIISSVVKGWGKVQKEEFEKTTLPGHRSQPEIPTKKSIKKSQIQTPEASALVTTSVYHESPMVEIESETIEISDEPLLDGSNPEEVKKAFIYSEIFNRKF
jgi:hypothetical protein